MPTFRSSQAASNPEVAPRIALPWIVRLRYALAIGEIATILAVDMLLGIDLPLQWILLLPGLTLLSNAWLARWSAQSEPERVGASRVLGRMFVLDTLCLTAALMLSGGPNNPFSLLYLVSITLSATILTKRQTWGLGALATLCFALLFWVYRPIPQLEMHVMGGGANLHLMGMWIGFGVAAFLVAMFAGKISELLREREESLIRMQAELAKKDRLASLVTLAAGAAHELATPLATIAVVARELERATQASQGASGSGEIPVSTLREDSQLIRTEVERCREILSRMSAQGAEPMGEAPEWRQVSEIIDAVAGKSLAFCTVQTQVSPEVGAARIFVPPRAFQQAVIGLVKNAADASPADSSPENCPVTISAELNPASGQLHLSVIDQGTGMSTDTLRHIGEPFFTTKEPGKGMGLGVFLMQTLADRIDGSLAFTSRPGQGTTATLQLPVNLSPKQSLSESAVNQRGANPSAVKRVVKQ